MRDQTTASDAQVRVGQRELGNGAFAAEAFTLPAFITLGWLVFGEVDDVARALGVLLGCLVVAAFGAALALSASPRPSRAARIRFGRTLAFNAAMGVVIAGVISAF